MFLEFTLLSGRVPMLINVRHIISATQEIRAGKKHTMICTVDGSALVVFEPYEIVRGDIERVTDASQA